MGHWAGGWGVRAGTLRLWVPFILEEVALEELSGMLKIDWVEDVDEELDEEEEEEEDVGAVLLELGGGE